MDSPTDNVVKRAVEAHQEGRLKEAGQMYRSILREQPCHPDANHNLAVIALAAGDTEAALPLLEKALTANSNIDQFWLSYVDCIIRMKDFHHAQQALADATRVQISTETLGIIEKQIASMHSLSAPPPQQAISDLEAHYHAGRLIEAEKIATSLTEDFPDHQFAWKALGALLGQTGRLSASIDPLQKSLQLSPRDVEAHFNLGNTLRQLGRFKEAEKSYRTAATLKPNYAEAHNNLGIVLQDMDRLVEAEESYRRSIEVRPDFAEPRSNLGNVLKELGRLGEAEESYRRAIALQSHFAETHNNLGSVLQRMGRSVEAEESYIQATILKPKYVRAHYNLGNAQKEQGRFVEAQASYARALALNPKDERARHMLAALSGETTASAPLEYVENLFDGYALDFESSLVDNLGYEIPKLISEIVLRDMKSKSWGSVLDLGCGTGLLGAEIKDYSEHLVGIDISNNMLAKAHEKKVYDDLIKRDIVAYLEDTPLNFDFFIATDVFVYLGDLSDIFRLIQSRNQTSGKLIFSVEHMDQDGFALRQSGRYSHSKNYVEELCGRYNYQIEFFQTQNLRKENDIYICGGLYMLSF